jgi:2-polyprenyl-3-methyl-5-hydroxy-6-metoxy-1,4-benzoquinol methylase
MIYDKLAPYYAQFTDPDLLQTYEEMILKNRTTGTIIDLGCGTADLSISLAKKGFHVTATDISEEMLDRANHNAVSQGTSIRFYVHNILEPLNQIYDVILMTSDVINYIHDPEEVTTVFKHISEAMDKHSIFLFDFIHAQYMERIHNYKQDILLEDELLQWSVRKTNHPYQIQHTLRFGNDEDRHIQTSFPPKLYRKLLRDAGLVVTKKRRTDERIIFQCMKK